MLKSRKGQAILSRVALGAALLAREICFLP
jgi:hypothetical protein